MFGFTQLWSWCRRLALTVAALTVLGVCPGVSVAAGGEAARAYSEARKLFFNLASSDLRRSQRQAWLRTIAAFHDVGSRFPGKTEAQKALFTEAELWSDLHRVSGREADLSKALARYGAVVRLHPRSSLADDALWHRAEILEHRRGDKRRATRVLAELLRRYPDGDMAEKARSRLSALRAYWLEDGGAGEAEESFFGGLLRRLGGGGSKRLVVLDPGHGGKDAGAAASRIAGSGLLREKVVALEIAAAAAEILRAAGVRTRLTRTDDVFVPLDERGAVAADLGADVFVSVHLNSNEDKTVSGVETYYWHKLAANSRESFDLAETVQERLVKIGGSGSNPVRDLGVKRGDFAVLSGLQMPAVLVEAAFLSNPDERRRLGNSDYPRRLGRAIGDAILQYLRSDDSRGPYRY